MAKLKKPKLKKVKIKKAKPKKPRRQRKLRREVIYLIRQFYRVQEHRIAFGGQLRALEEAGLDTNPLKMYYGQLYDLEKAMAKDVKAMVKDEEIYKEFLKKVRGIGPLISAGLVNLIDIKKARHVSSLWKFAGLDVVNGEAPRRRRGQKSTWNPLMRMLCWKIGRSFLMSKSPYKKLYDKRKEYETRKHPELTKMHLHNRAIRYAVKRFLCDFWITWRQLEGLSVTQPYAVSKLGHKLEKPIVE